MIKVPLLATVLSASAVLAVDGASFDAQPPVTAEFEPGVVLVRFWPQLQEGARVQVRAQVQGAKEAEYALVPGLEKLRIGGDVRAAVAALNEMGTMVLYAEPDYLVHRCVTPNDPSFGNLWGLHNTGQTVNGDPGIADADIDAPEGWDIFTGSNIVIADIDTGVNYNHVDLAANSWINPAEVAGNGVDDDANGFIDDVRGWDFYNNDNNPIDDNGHGTHTSGTIGAVGNNGVGVVGVNWSCRIMALKFLSAGGSGSTSGAISCLNYAVARGCDVSNNSWGGGGYSQSLFDAINAARAQGHVFVAAAGNNGSNNDSLAFYPASYDLDNIIAVAATDNNDNRASFSNYGATTVDVGAPGVTIYSTYGNGYAYLNGTSMATPHVAGLVALLQGQNPGWTYSQVIQRIYSTVRPISALSGRCTTGGVINVHAALNNGPVNTAPTVTISSPSNGQVFSVGSSITFAGSASDAQDGDLTAGKSWTSNIQGALGTGGSFARSDLVVGTHVVTASATDSGNLTGSASVIITVQDPNNTPPAAPTNLTGQRSGQSAILTWTDNANNESGFNIERQRRIGNSWTNTTTLGPAPANATSFTDTPGSGRWRYRVRAFNGAGNSAWTVYVQVRI